MSEPTQDIPGAGPLDRPSEQDGKRKKQKLADRHFDTQVRIVMATPDGRAVLRSILEHSRIWTWDSIVNVNARALAHDAGRRYEGGWLWSELQRICPDQAELLLAEGRRKESADG